MKNFSSHICFQPQPQINAEPPAFEEPWQVQLAHAYTRVSELLQAGLVSPQEAQQMESVAGRYQMRLPRYYAQLIDRDHLGTCPIRKQALPDGTEEDPVLPAWAQAWCRQVYGRDVPWAADPIGDVRHLEAPRLTHRYQNRAILHISPACALYCRFCFRKAHLNDAERTLYAGSLDPALAYLSAHPHIRELILTGGDPLALSDKSLERFLKKVSHQTSIQYLRIHTRMPVTLPARLSQTLGQILVSQDYRIALVAHFNHPKELTRQALSSLGYFKRLGIDLYNQTVLLRGVNAQLHILEDLFQRLYEHGMVPFYLHHPDWTPGTFHFRISIAYGRALCQALAGRLSGPAMPHYMLDMPGGWGKVRLLDASVEQVDSRRTPDLEGALYRMVLPQTRQSYQDTPSSESPDGLDLKHAWYAEFWRPI